MEKCFIRELGSENALNLQTAISLGQSSSRWISSQHTSDHSAFYTPQIDWRPFPERQTLGRGLPLFQNAGSRVSRLPSRSLPGADCFLLVWYKIFPPLPALPPPEFILTYTLKIPWLLPTNFCNAPSLSVQSRQKKLMPPGDRKIGLHEQLKLAEESQQ